MKKQKNLCINILVFVSVLTITLYNCSKNEDNIARLLVLSTITISIKNSNF